MVVIFGRIKPQIISFFSPKVGAAISVNVGLNPPILASDIPQKLKINFIVSLLINVSVRHL